MHLICGSFSSNSEVAVGGTAEAELHRFHFWLGLNSSLMLPWTAFLYLSCSVCTDESAQQLELDDRQVDVSDQDDTQQRRQLLIQSHDGCSVQIFVVAERLKLWDSGEQNFHWSVERAAGHWFRIKRLSLTLYISLSLKSISTPRLRVVRLVKGLRSSPEGRLTDLNAGGWGDAPFMPPQQRHLCEYFSQCEIAGKELCFSPWTFFLFQRGLEQTALRWAARRKCSAEGRCPVPWFTTALMTISRA